MKPPTSLMLFAGALAGAMSWVSCNDFRAAPSSPNGSATEDGGGDTGAGASGSAFALVQQTKGGPSLSDVFGFGPDDVYAVGENGTMLHFDGNTWTPNRSVTTGALMTRVWGLAANDVYALGVLAEGARGILMHNDGRGWVEEREFDDGLSAIWGTEDFVLIGGLNGKIYKKTKTRDWFLAVTLEKNPYAKPEPDIHSDDKFMPVVDSLWGNDAKHIGAACDLDTTVFYRDPGQWIPEYDPVNRKRRFRKVWGPPGDNYNLFFGANYNGVWRVVDDISSAITLHEDRDTPERANEAIWGIWGTSSDSVLFVGDKGRMMSWDGRDIVDRPSPTPTGLSAVWGSSADDVWIVGDDMTILHGTMPR